MDAKPCMKTISEIKKAIDTIAGKLCSPELLKPRFYSNEKQPVVSYEVCLNQEDHVVIRIVTKTGPFGENKRVCERKYYSIDYVDKFKIENHLLNALTWDGSPFYIKNSLFFKSREIM